MSDARHLTVAVVVGLALGLAGCGGEDGGGAGDDGGEGHAAEAHGHGHTHEALHGGALVAVGEHFAHLEVVLDDEAGRVTLYVLDGHAEGGQRVAHETLTLRVTRVDGEARRFEVTLDAVASALTGETVGDTSQFEGADERLAGVERFRGELAAVTIRGRTFEDVGVSYPEGSGGG